MNKLRILIIFIICVNSVLGQRPTQPSIMVVPSYKLMNTLGCMTEINNQGTIIYNPDYNKALIKDPNLKQIISKINELFSEKGFPLTLLEASLKDASEDETEDIVIQNKSGGAIATSAFDKLLYRVKPDIYIDLDYSVETNGSLKSINFNVEAYDAYTKNSIAQASGFGPKSLESNIGKLFEEAILTFIPNLQSLMQTYFDNISLNGREIYVRVQMYDDAGFDMEEEFGTSNIELGEILTKWIKDNSVKNSASLVKQTTNEIRMKVKIPLYDSSDNNTPMSANEFSNKLKKYLRDNYGIKSTNLTQSIGDGRIVIKSKK